jgi:quinoprotein glucose dehydrogenase
MRGLKAFVIACSAGASLYTQTASRSAEWATYSGGAEGQRYSPLSQINTKNVSGLKLAWQYGVPAAGVPVKSVGRSQAIPIFVRGVLYTSTTQRTIVALNPATGDEIWKYELEKGGAPNRGVSYWAGEGRLSGRILAGTSDGRLLALDAGTGKPVPTFGDQGAIDLRAGVAEKFPKMPYSMASPGIIYRNLIITGAQGQEDNPEGPAMDVRAWDVRTGKLIWTFHTIPHPGEPGYEPGRKALDDRRFTRLGLRSGRRRTGLIFLPIGQPASQCYGGHRAQQNLYSSSVMRSMRIPAGSVGTFS